MSTTSARPRILTMQRQLREAGRLRNGYLNDKGDPVKSKTWVVTSHSQDAVVAAAEQWGGQPQQWKPMGNGAAQWRVITDAPSIDVVLPPDDPMSQSYELWSRGGCQLRCDGETELLGNRPCVCRARFGDEFHTQKPGTVCKPHTRIGVLVPALPLGIWRIETSSYYAAMELPAMIDLLKSQVGWDAMIPLSARIEPRTRVAQGKTKQFTVILLELRRQSTQALLAGEVPVYRPAALAGGEQRPAIGASPAAAPTAGAVAELGAAPGAAPTPARDWAADISEAASPAALDTVGQAMAAAGAGTPALRAAYKTRMAELKAAHTTPAQHTPEPQQAEDGDGGWPAAAQPPDAAAAAQATDPDPELDAEEAEVEPDKATVWQEILVEAKARGWNLTALRDRFAGFTEVDHRDPRADGFLHAAFLDAVRDGRVA